jgi:hypothetical protein
MVKKTGFGVVVLIAIFLLCIKSASGAIVLNTKTFRLEFDSDGRPASFKTQNDNKEMLGRSFPGEGFFITNVDKARMRLTNLQLKEGKLIAASANGTQEAIFTVKEADRYLRFIIESLKGFPADSGFILAFDMKADPSVRVFATDYMTDETNRGDGISVEWNYLWNRDKANPLGSFALYQAPDKAAEDDILLQIWAGESLPHPKIQGEWTYQRAKEWVSQWQMMFKDQSQFILEAENLQDLYAGIPYAQKIQAKQIYLFTNTWRGDFWPSNQGNWQLRKDVFPNGESDLRKYSVFLLEKGIYLKLHYLSGSLGFSDPVYIADKPDRRLASWGSGVLSQPASAEEKTLYFKPNTGVQFPHHAPRGEAIIPPALDNVHGFNYMRIENEIILVGSFENTNQGIWTLRDCVRGKFTTKATPHPQDAEAAGLIDTYGQNFLPGNDTTLLEEIAKGYAEFCNRCKVYNVEFDGFENHAYYGRWGSEKFASLIYQNLDHPVTSGSSGARAPDCWIEYKLNSTKELMKGFRFHVHSSRRAPLFLDEPSRQATKLLNVDYELSIGAAEGTRSFGLCKPQPMFGLTVQELKTYGLTEQMTRAVNDWKKVSSAMTAEQRAVLKNSLIPSAPRFQDASREPQSAIIYCLESKDNTAFMIKPTKVLTRKEGDINWHSWQEHGPIEPKQYIKPGEKLELENPFGEQPLQFIIRVLWAGDYNSKDNYVLQPDVSKMKNTETMKIVGKDNMLGITGRNDSDRDLWETEKLPEWSMAAVNMNQHRIVGMWVTGDNSGSVLLLNIPGRDYVVPLNFQGRRYIEIPNGEASWASGFWGWRVGTHRSDYSRVGRFKIGFGHIPAKTQPRVKLEGLKAVAEINSQVTNMTISTSKGLLTVKGTVSSSQYVEYKGGDRAIVYDKNWNKVAELPVETQNYQIPRGGSQVGVSVPKDGPLPWLEVQFITQGTPMMVSEDSVK